MSEYFDLKDIISGVLGTLIAALLTIILVAEMKMLRIRKELKALSNLLIKTYETRVNTTDASPQAETMDSVRIQLKELLAEIAFAKEGILSVSYNFRKKLESLEKDILEIIEHRFFRDFARALFGNDEHEEKFRQKILSLGTRAKSMSRAIWFGTLLFP